MEAWSRKRGFAVAPVLAALVLAAIAAGCGDEDSSAGSGSGGEGSSSNKAEFAKEGNEACAKEREDTLERAAAYAEGNRSDGLSEAELARRALRSAVLSTIGAEVAALGALSPPAGEEEEVEAVLAAQQKALEKAEKSARTDEDVERYFLGAADKALRSYGLTGCTKGVNPGPN